MPRIRALKDRTAVSPEVVGQNVTFRLLAPDALRVEVALNYPYAVPRPLVKSEDGIWSITLRDLEPRWYPYFFYLDGVAISDPANPRVGQRINQGYSLVNVPSVSPRVDENQPVPRGVVHRHYYRSQVLDAERRLFVYTPPGYSSARRLPTLYLRHGAEQVEDSWLAAGRADTIVDNLLAGGDCVPMVMVFANGYGLPQTGGQLRADRNTRGMMARLADELRRDVVPFVESHYATGGAPQHRAIAGLSMGAGQSFIIGLNNLDVFGHVGVFSSGVISAEGFDMKIRVPDLAEAPAAVAQMLQSLWLGCGADDRRVIGYARIRAELAALGIPHEYCEVPGSHEWRTWRALLANYLPTVFRQRTLLG